MQQLILREHCQQVPIKNALAASIDAGRFFTFEVPKDVLDTWKAQGHARQGVDLDLNTGIQQPEVKIFPPKSGEMNNYLKNE